MTRLRMSGRRVTVTGATGLIGPRLVRELQGGGWDVTVLSRDPDRARAKLPGVEAHAWDLMSDPAPVGGARGPRRRHPPRRRARRPALERLLQAGHPRKPRGWAPSTCSRGCAAPSSAPRSWSAPRRPATTALTARSRSTRRLPRAMTSWPRSASPGRPSPSAPSSSGMRVLRVRTGVVLDSNGGALEKMLPPFKLGVGGPVAGGRQYMPWVHAEDVVGIMRTALEDESWSGAANATAPVPVTNARVLQGARASPPPALAPARPRRRAESCSTARCRRSSRPAPASSRPGR